MDLKFKVMIHVGRPVGEVFEAVADPKQLSSYFTTGGASGGWSAGETVTWDFHDFPGAFPVEVDEVVPNEKIVLRWEAAEGEQLCEGALDVKPAGYKTTVTMWFKPTDDGRTLVEIEEKGWRETEGGLRPATAIAWAGRRCSARSRCGSSMASICARARTNSQATWRSTGANGLRPSQRSIVSIRSRSPVSISRSSSRALAHAFDAHPDGGHRPERAGDIKIDVMARIDRAEIDRVAGLDDQPPVAIALRRVGILELDDQPARRRRVEPQAAAHVPHQQLGIELFERQFAGDPALAPFAEGFDQRLKLAAGLGQRIFVDGRFARNRRAGDDPGFLQLLQALRQEGGRHSRQAAAQVVEAGRAGEQLAKQDDRPARTKHFRRHRHRAELVVAAFHRGSRIPLNPAQHAAPLQFLYRGDSVAELAGAGCWRYLLSIPWKLQRMEKRMLALVEKPMTTDWTKKAEEIAAAIAEHAARHDADDSFVAEGFAALEEAGFFSALVPEELGGGGASVGEICDAIRIVGAACGSTALAAAMHSHIVAVAAWRWKNQGAPTDGLLKRIAAEKLKLVSSGGSDWLKSAGTMEKVEGGYRLTARKAFASGSPTGNLLMTSAVYDDPADGPTVLHFAAPLKGEGVTHRSRPGRRWACAERGRTTSCSTECSFPTRRSPASGRRASGTCCSTSSA